VFDVDTPRAAGVAAEVGARLLDSAEAVIASAEVEAVVLASPSPLHADQAIACIRAGKPVLCEKPLAPTLAECEAVLNAEVIGGRRLVQLGFMRRFDPGYLEVKHAIDSGAIGTPLMAHCVHRNISANPGFRTEMSMTDSVIHEFDIVRWLFGEEIAAVRVLFPRRSPNAREGADPQIAVIEMASGALVDVESFIECRYGYDVRCEVVGSEGLATLENPRLTTRTTVGARVETVHESWVQRFDETYRIELQAWVDAVRAGTTVGASTWDGYAATAASNAAVRSQTSGEREPVAMIERPAFYA
jgi:myo-inositol 2-dehydrogenase/D-chiro-inositol 1-dehydrogenase